MRILLAFLLLVLAAAPPFVPRAGAAVAVGETFSDPVMEQRARDLQRKLRCLVCQGESIDDSNSPFAADVRQLVRQQIAEGKSDQQIQDFLVARYGNFILMQPPLQADTWLLWLAPFLALGAGGAVAVGVSKRAAARKS